MELRTIRPRIADVAREAGVSKTAVSFAFNSPDRLAPETALRIREIAEHLGLHPAPRRADAHPAPDADDRRAHAPGPVGHLLEPVLRRVQRGRRRRRRGVRVRTPLHLAASRFAGRGDEPGDGRRRGRDRPERRPPRGGADPAGRRADRPGRLDRAPRARLGRDRRRRRGARGRGAPDRPRATATSWSSASSRRRPRSPSIRTASPAAACAAIARRSPRPASTSPTRASSSGRPASTAGLPP